jgi:hypothetical protein
MLRFYCRLMMILLFGIVFLVSTMTTIGNFFPLPPALRGFVEGCAGRSNPCWYGIVIGESTLTEAEMILVRLGYEDIGELNRQFLNSRTYRPAQTAGSCSIVIYHAPPSGAVNGMTFHDCRLFLGDMVSVYGAPDSLQFQASGEGEWRYESRGMYIGFSDDFMPYSTFDRIIMQLSLPTSTTSFNWHGYTPHWRYCQLEPESSFCP